MSNGFSLFDWQKDFSGKYLNDIKYYCLVMSENYIEKNFSDILKFENAIERRLSGGGITKSGLIADIRRNLRFCNKYNLNYILIDEKYEINIKP